MGNPLPNGMAILVPDQTKFLEYGDILASPDRKNKYSFVSISNGEIRLYDGKDVFDLSLKKKWPNGIINMIFVARLDSVKRMKDCLIDSEEFFPVKVGQFYRMRNIMGTDTYSVAIRTGNDDSHMVGLNICDFDEAMFYEDVDPDDFGRVEPVSTPEVGDFLVHPLPNEKYEFSFVIDANRFLTYDRGVSDFLLHHYLDKYKIVGHGAFEKFLRVAKDCDYDKWVAKVIQMSEDLKNR